MTTIGICIALFISAVMMEVNQRAKIRKLKQDIEELKTAQKTDRGDISFLLKENIRRNIQQN